VDYLYRKIKVWDLAAALDPRAPTGSLCMRTLVVSLAGSRFLQYLNEQTLSRYCSCDC